MARRRVLLYISFVVRLKQGCTVQEKEARWESYGERFEWVDELLTYHRKYACEGTLCRKGIFEFV